MFREVRMEVGEGYVRVSDPVPPNPSRVLRREKSGMS